MRPIWKSPTSLCAARWTSFSKAFVLDAVDMLSGPHYNADPHRVMCCAAEVCCDRAGASTPMPKDAVRGTIGDREGDHVHAQIAIAPGPG